DPVTVVDTETERLLRDRLAELRPGEQILGEEEGGSTGDREGLTWVLDPIDGTVNFVYGIETYAVSVAVQRDGASLAGAVAHVPAGAVYSAALGHGAHVQRAGVDANAYPSQRNRGLAGGGVDLFQQRWIGRLCGVGPQARQHRVDVVAVGQLAELGADGQVDGVIAALVLEQLGARRDQPHRGRGGAPRRTETDLALAFQPGSP